VNALRACHRAWIARAIETLTAEHRREHETPLILLDLPEFPGIDVVLKDESLHPTGSLKHRLARSLFLHAICNGDVHEGTIVVEASSGSTAISEAYFANLLGLAFIAVVPRGTAPRKLQAIADAGAQIRLVDPGHNISDYAAQLACDLGGHFMNQFKFAERATDWRGDNNIAQSLFAQISDAQLAMPRWIVIGAGTGGTSATMGRYVRYRPDLASTRLCVVDPEGSAFFRYFSTGDRGNEGTCRGVVEGIGRPHVEPSFMRNVIDEMIQIADEASVAGTLWLEKRTSRRFGPSTGANIVGALTLASEMLARGDHATIATFACDSGDRYADTVYDPTWLESRGINIRSWQERFAALSTNARGFGSELQRAQAARLSAVSRPAL
jgi:cysteine synthase A